MKISIIIPTHNRHLSLERALKTLVPQLSNDCEIIVVLDGCEDATHTMLSNLFPEVKQVVFLRNVGAAIGLNAGFRASMGEIVLFLDDDMEFKDGLIKEHLSMYASGEYDVVVGHFPLGYLPKESYFRQVVYEWTEGWQKSFGNNVSFYDSLCSGHFSIRQEFFDQVGGFDEEFSRWGRKDSELGYRLLQVGARFGFCFDAQAVQNYDKNPSDFLKDFRLLGRADVEMCEKHPELRSTTLLSSYYQAPWMIRWLRERLNENPRNFEDMLPWISQYLNFLHENGFKGKLYEGFLWAMSDQQYWLGVRGTLEEIVPFEEFVGNPASILLYHRIDNGRSPFSVSKVTFSLQMEYLRNNGYNVITLKSLVDALRYGSSLPKKSVVLTFDDAFCDFLVASEILSIYGFPATIFVPTAYIGKDNGWENEFMLSQQPILSDIEIRNLVDLGYGIELHGHRHAPLAHMSEDDIREDLRESIRQLKLLGSEASILSYPFGSYDKRVIEIAKQLGLVSAVTCVSTHVSKDSSIFELPRITIEEGTIEDFSFRLRFGISLYYATNEFVEQLSSFRPTKWWHDAPKFNCNRIYQYQVQRPEQ